MDILSTSALRAIYRVSDSYNGIRCNLIFLNEKDTTLASLFLPAKRCISKQPEEKGKKSGASHPVIFETSLSYTLAKKRGGKGNLNERSCERSREIALTIADR